MPNFVKIELPDNGREEVQTQNYHVKKVWKMSKLDLIIKI